MSPTTSFGFPRLCCVLIASAFAVPVLSEEKGSDKDKKPAAKTASRSDSLGEEK